jgi:hypothetical protein
MLPQLETLRRRVRDVLQNARIAWTYARAGVRSRPPNDEERSLLLTIPRLIEAGYPLPFDASREIWKARSFPDGVFELRYAYEALHAQDNNVRLVLYCRAECAPLSEKAVELFRNIVQDYESGVDKVGGRFVFKGNLQRWADNAHVSFMFSGSNDSLIGCLLSFQRERLVYTVLLRGIVLDREEDIEELLYPLLDGAFNWCGGRA